MLCPRDQARCALCRLATSRTVHVAVRPRHPWVCPLLSASARREDASIAQYGGDQRSGPVSMDLSEGDRRACVPRHRSPRRGPQERRGEGAERSRRGDGCRHSRLPATAPSAPGGRRDCRRGRRRGMAGQGEPPDSKEREFPFESQSEEFPAFSLARHTASISKAAIQHRKPNRRYRKCIHVAP